MDRFTALKVFRKVVEAGSFAEASRQLRLSPAAISKNIGELEAHLNVRLLNRTTRRMSLTEGGVRYYEQIAQVLDDLARADNSLGPLQQMPSGHLRVTAPMSLSLICLSSKMSGFLSLYPDLTLDLNLEDRRVDIIKEGYDLAIRGADNLQDTSLVARKLMTMRNVLCGAPTYFERCGIPTTPTHLKHHNIIQYSLSSHTSEWSFRKGERTFSIPIDGRFKVSSSLAVRDALLAGFGISLIPWPYVKADVEQGRLQTVLEDWATFETSVYAVYPSRRHLEAKTRVFLDFVGSVLRGE